MLETLRIKNIALIDSLEVEFGEGLNILTGETGAGKSVVIGAVGIALGGRFDRTLLRDEEADGLVEILFSLDENVKQRLLLAEAIPEDLLSGDELLITRKLTKNRVVNRINGETVPIKQLKDTAEILINLHAQHEQTTLLRPARHLEILDSSDERVLAKKEEVRQCYGRVQDIRQQLEHQQMDPGERAKRIDFLRFQIEEIEAAKLIPGEDEELEIRFRKMSHAEDLLSICTEVSRLTGDESASGGGSQISRAAKRIQDLTRYESGSELPSQLSEVESLLADFNQSLTEYMDEISYDPEELRMLTDRLDLLNGLKAKYGKTIEDVIDTKERLAGELSDLEEADSRIEELLQEKEKEEDKLKKAADELTELRNKAAKPLAARVTEALKDMNFTHVEFYAAFEKTETITSGGQDEVCFMLSTNLGEQARPLHKVASGGELSRVMLAIKATLSDASDTPTLVFDEIDVGISGVTAQKIGQLLKKLAGTRQLLVITHLPQIAAVADSSYRIDKEVSGEKTFTTLTKLDEEGRVYELARLMGGEQISDSILQSARELLQSES